MNIGRWSLGLVTDYEECRQEKKRSIFWTETFSSHVYKKKLQGVFYLGKTICGTAGFHFDV